MQCLALPIPGPVLGMLFLFIALMLRQGPDKELQTTSQNLLQYCINRRWQLADLGHGVVLCEGGPTWLGELVAADRLDELCLSIAPVMGGDPLPVALVPPESGLASYQLSGTMVEDDTLFLRYERTRGERRG